MEKWRLKKIIKKMLPYLVVCFIAEIILISEIFSNIAFNKEMKFYFILITMVPFLTIIMVPVGVYLITNALKKKNQNASKDYYREIDDEYTPAMASFILDDFLERNEAILATILDLSLKKCLDLKEIDNQLTITAKDLKEEKLYDHELYIIESIKNGVKINSKRFKEELIFDCKNEKLIIDRTEPWVKILITMRQIIVVVALILLIVGGSNTAIIGIGFIIIAYISKFLIKENKKTIKGIEFATRVKGLKNYLKDYTLLQEKDYDYTTIVDRYMPYALALGEANKIEKLHIESNKLISRYIEEDEVILDDI